MGSTGQSTGVHLHFSWIIDNANAMKYCQADYMDFEKYEFINEMEGEKDMTKDAAKQIIKDVCKFDDNTINCLDSYIYRDELIIRLAEALL